MKGVAQHIDAVSFAAVTDFLKQRGTEAYVVGGYVRDTLLARKSADMDIAVRGDALGIARQVAGQLYGRFVLLDEPTHTARVVFPRPDGAVCVDFSGFEESIESDLSRRDFTIDAMAVDASKWTGGRVPDSVIDPFGGRSDMASRRIRAVREEVFREDPARLLRGVRLAGEFDFGIEEGTRALMARDAALVSGVAGERARDELVRIFSLRRSARLIALMYDLGLLLAVFPELAPARDFEQKGVHVWDVLTHSRHAVAAAEYLVRQGEWEFAPGARELVRWSEDLDLHFHAEVGRGTTRATMLRIAALFHDVAKPQTKSVEENGRWRFLEHARLGAFTAGGALKRLRFGRREIELVETEVSNHLRPAQMTQSDLPSRRAVYRLFRDTHGAGIDVLFLALADYLATHGARLDEAGWSRQARLVDHVLEEGRRQEVAAAPLKLIDGNELMRAFALPPGPLLGRLLASVREAQATGEVGSREDALALVRRLLSGNGGPGEGES